MVQLGYILSAEEHTPTALVHNAKRAEDVGFTFTMVSDHFHPWIDAQGHSPFVWSVLGGIAQVTSTIKVGTGVTCPTSGGISGQISQELPLPSHFERAAALVRKEDMAGSGAHGPDPAKYIELIEQGISAGFDHTYLHQVGDDQESFFRFAGRKTLPQFRQAAGRVPPVAAPIDSK